MLTLSNGGRGKNTSILAFFAVAKQILAVPATSVPSERVFSTAGLVVNKLRNRLSPDLVDSIIFLNKNIFPVSETSDNSDMQIMAYEGNMKIKLTIYAVNGDTFTFRKFCDKGHFC